MSPDGKRVHLEVSKTTLASFAESLSPMVERPVVDATGLKGNYQIELELSVEDLMTAARSAGAPVPTAVGGAGPETDSDPVGDRLIFSAIQKLGLRLQARKVKLDRIVIESIEKMPSDN
jgi:uncharacterized protein (TIGR03435 family)